MSQVVTPTLVPALSGSQDVKDSARGFVSDEVISDNFRSNQLRSHRFYFKKHLIAFFAMNTATIERFIITEDTEDSGDENSGRPARATALRLQGSAAELATMTRSRSCIGFQ